jgi:hypothetical protein
MRSGYRNELRSRVGYDVLAVAPATTGNDVADRVHVTSSKLMHYPWWWGGVDQFGLAVG